MPCVEVLLAALCSAFISRCSFVHIPSELSIANGSTDHLQQKADGDPFVDVLKCESLSAYPPSQSPTDGRHAPLSPACPSPRLRAAGTALQSPGLPECRHRPEEPAASTPREWPNHTSVCLGDLYVRADPPASCENCRKGHPPVVISNERFEVSFQWQFQCVLTCRKPACHHPDFLRTFHVTARR
jgi:hypothetical protein